MVFELHVYGPAFGLPSIDVECLATIIYLQQCLPLESWTLVASNNPGQNPYQTLPALKDANIWVAGFDQIVRFIREQSQENWNLDASLNETQRADRDAFRSFVQSRGLPLLDLSLYVSSDNYTTVVRGAWSDLLSWPESWTIPHRFRDKAKRRSEHLGLSALDVDTTQGKDKEDGRFAAHIPKSLRKSKQTVSGLLGQGTQNTRFRLDTVTADFLEPLQKQLGSKEWLIGDSISSIDCLVVAYLTLMQTPELPQAWLKDALTKKHVKLGRWSANIASTILGPSISTTKVAQDDGVESRLPWAIPSDRTWAEIGATMLETVIGSMPIIRLGHEKTEVCDTRESRSGWSEQKQLAHERMRRQQVTYSRIVAGCIGIASATAWAFHIGILAWPRGKVQPSRRNFGQAGILLGL